MYVLGICDSSAILNVFWIIKLVIMIISVCVPIILMVMLMIDFMKAIQVGDQDLLKKARDIAVKRSIACVLIFLVPTFVNVLTKVTSGNSDYHVCYEGATLDYISQRKSEEKEAQRLSLEALKEANKKKTEEYNDEDNSLLLGALSTNVGNKMVQVAINELGNENGVKYKKWKNVSLSADWCDIFLAWVANEVGVLNVNYPNVLGTGNIKRWFESKDRYKKKNSYTPKPGDIVFFQFDDDESVDHVGMVEYVDKNGKIHTIEGNTINNKVERKVRSLSQIFGFGIV